VLDIDEEDRETGYHWRILDPMATNANFRKMCADIKFMIHDDAIRLPVDWVEATLRRATTIYKRFEAMRWIPKRSSTTSHRIYDLFVDDVSSNTVFKKPRPIDAHPYEEDSSMVSSVPIVMFANDRFHFVTTLDKIADEKNAIHNITLALNEEFNIQQHLSQQVSKMLIDSTYPYIGAFVNEPYDDETENVKFVDPHDWISMVYRGKCTVPDYINQALMDHTKYKDLLQRQAVITSKLIPAGEELLVNYKRG
jgi:hypothetical protein